MRSLQRAVVLLTALAVVGVPASTSGVASAAPLAPSVGGQAASVAPCLTDLADRLQDVEVPKWREHLDHAPITQADLDQLPAEETTRRYVAREVAPALPSRVTVPVHVHVIKGKHRGESNKVGRKRINQMIQILNAGMSGAQSSTAAPTRYRFAFKSVDYRKRDGWYHAYFNGPRAQKMKRALHRGGAGSLNLYVNGGGPTGYPVLGSATFPWQYAANPRLDGVIVNVAALPGGKANGYNLGDTVTHETGHWLGLYHTFQGGCGEQGDLVSDTAAENEPSFYCQTTRDTCPAPGLDPVRNFMDYSLDSCMTGFTAGQVRRMDSAFEKWRQ